jgi:hypothetical protein
MSMPDGAPPPRTPSVAAETRACRRFGWTALAVWSVLGLAIETAHGFKWARILDDGVVHTLLRLAHAHGIGLALGVVVYGVSASSLYGDDGAAARTTGRLLRLAAVLMPVGFAASVWGHGEADPSPAIALVPVGAAALVVASIRLAGRAWRQ